MTDSKKPSIPSDNHPVVGFDGTALFRKTDGIGRYTYNLLKSYAELHPNTKIIVIGFLDDDISLCDLFTHFDNISLHRLPFPRKIYQGIYSRIIRIPVDAFIPHIDILICTNFVHYPYTRKVPSLVIIHDLVYIHHPEVVEKKNLTFLKKHVPRTIRQSRVIASSNFTKKAIEDTFSPKYPVQIASNGIDYSIFTKPRVTDRENFVLTVGTIEPRKNLTRLLTAYQSLPKKLRDNHPLVVVGNGGWGDQPAPVIDGVTYTGYISDSELADLYKKAGLFIFPSIYEGFGLPLLEALVSNTPTICSDIPPLKDIAGDTVNYFNPFDESDIATVLTRALSQKKKHTDISDQLQDTYSWQRSAKALEIIINSTLQDK